MYLIQILLPLYDEENHLFDKLKVIAVRNELLEKYSGVTAFTQRPAEGLWKDEQGKVVPDEVVIYEVMTVTLNAKWWGLYRKKLESRFRQDTIVIRSHIIKLL